MLERWQQIDNLLQAVIERPIAEREALLAKACSQDKSLRQAVESLLSFEESAEGFLTRAALEDAAELFCESQNEFMAGQLIGSYRIEGWLGSGGMGEVYLAEDTKLDRKVAIKFLPPYLEEDEIARKRLIGEAKAAAQLDHPNICAVYEVNAEANLSFIVMQYVAGRTLDDKIKSQTLPLSEALDICVQVVEAIAEAHARGIVHRDIKPGNIMITSRGKVKVLDFGLAKVVGWATSEQVDVKQQNMLSRPGERPGTPPYMSPEQAKGDAIDARSDLFAAGAILYECVVGSRPFSGQTEREILDQVIHFSPPIPSKLNPNLPAELDSIVIKALAKQPNARYQSADDMLEQLRALRLRLQTSHEASIKTLPIKLEASKTSLLAILARASRQPPVYLSATSLIIGVVLLAYFNALPELRAAHYSAITEAVHWYDKGTMALRNGAYYEASKELQQAIGVDSKFALAHARLAEAFTELDYIEAKDEIIRAESLARELRLSEADTLYLKAVTSTVLRDFPSAIESYQQIANQAADDEKVNVHLDLGRAYEKNDELEKARQSYQQASDLAPQSPAAFLRLGVVCGKLQDFKFASEAFMKAQGLYEVLNNQEGLAEVFYQRGFVFIDEGKVEEARGQLENAIEIANATVNQHQLVRARQALSTVLAMQGKLIEAEQQATDAIQLALNNNIESQAVSGSIRLGDALLVRGNYNEAERHYRQALEIAQRFKMRVNEAWARRQLGGLLSQQHKADEALNYLEPAAAFFQQQGYHKWFSQTATLLGRAYRDKGDYAAALKTFRELQQLGELLSDQSQVALAYIDIGNMFANEEQYTEALRYFDESYRIFASLKSTLYLGYAAKSRADVLWQLGHSDEAKAALSEATSIAMGVDGTYEPLLADIYLVDALLELSAGHFQESARKSRQALELANTKYTDVAVIAKHTLGLSRVRSSATGVGSRLCEEAVELATRTGDPQLLSRALLASAEANLENGELSRALEEVLNAQQNFGRLGKEDSEWRAWLIAAEVSRRRHDESATRQYVLQALSRLSDLEQKWGAEAYNSYLQRPDIMEFRKQLDRLLNP